MNGLSGVLWTVAVILLVLWILGFALNVTAGGLVHVLLVLFVIAVAFEVFRMATRSKSS